MCSGRGIGQPCDQQVRCHAKRCVTSCDAGRRRGVGCSVARVHDAPATQCDPGITAGLLEAATASRPLLRRVLGAAAATAAQPQQQQQQEPQMAAPGRIAKQQQQQQRRQQREANSYTRTSDAGDEAGSCAADGVASKPPALGAAGSPGSRSDAQEDSPEVPRLVSGAGHDALAMADAGPMGMLFVRCRNGGISHSPAELVDAEDVAAAAAALLTYLHAELA